MKLNRIIGLCGVSTNESTAARIWGRRLEWPMLLVALWIPIQWYLEAKHLLPHMLIRVDDWIIWLFFVGETSLLTYLVDNRGKYLRQNWLNLAIIAAGIPMLWNYTPLAGILRNLRLLLLLALILRFFPSVRKVLQRNQLGLTLSVAGIIAGIAGILLSAIDPGIPSIEDGIWYAWVTLATVGYGDVVPVSGAGRLIGAILILMGIGLLSLLTANVAAFLLSSDVEKVEREESAVLRRLDAIEAKIERLQQSIESIQVEATGRDHWAKSDKSKHASHS